MCGVPAISPVQAFPGQQGLDRLCEGNATTPVAMISSICQTGSKQ
jgi:hypothetical protein